MTVREERLSWEEKQKRIKKEIDRRSSKTRDQIRKGYQKVLVK